MRGHPHLFAIGDWVCLSLNKDGEPFCALGVEPARIEVCEIIGIVETGGPCRYTVHLAGENDKRYECPYVWLRHIPIDEDWLKDFGFETCENDENASYLYKEHCLRLDCRNEYNPEFDYFYLSWRENEDLTKEYKILFRGHVCRMVLLEDSLAEVQHFYFRFNHEWPMPMRYKGRSHFKMPKSEVSEIGPILEKMGIE